jgi:hypothetical protein
MLKKTLIALLALVALGATAAPAANATWTHNHTAIGGGSNPQEIFTGTVQLQNGALGQVHCPNIRAKIQMLGGTTEAIVTEITTQDPTKCHVKGFLGAQCGTFSLSTVELTKNAKATVVTNPANVAAITFENVVLYTEGRKAGGEPCFEIVHETTSPPANPVRHVTFTPNNAKTVVNGQLGGELDTPLFGVTNVTGTLAPEVANTYGFVAP